MHRFDAFEREEGEELCLVNSLATASPCPQWLVNLDTMRRGTHSSGGAVPLVDALLWVSRFMFSRVKNAFQVAAIKEGDIDGRQRKCQVIGSMI